MTNRDTILNSAMSVAGILFSTVVMLSIYRMSVAQLGMEFVGLWSVLSAITSIGAIGTFGLGGGMLKFAADIRSKGDVGKLTAIVNGVFWRMALFLAAFLVLLYVIATWGISFIVSTGQVEQALHLLPMALLIFWLTTLAQLILSAVEGLNKGWQRSILGIGGQLVLLGLTWLWIGEKGLHGLLYAQMVQAISLLIASFFLLRHNVPTYSFTLGKTKADDLQGVLEYGLKFQLQAILQMLGDPVTKFFLSRYGGLASVGYFEVASRLILQIRLVLMSAIQSLLPRVVDLQANASQDKLDGAFQRINAVSVDAFIIAFGGLFIFCPFIFEIWVGDREPMLSVYCRLLIVAWFVNACAVVPYLFNLGTGKLRANIISHGLITVLNVLLGLWVIVIGLSALWFVISWSVALLVGSMYLIMAVREPEGWLRKALFDAPHLWLWGTIIICGLLWYLLQSNVNLPGYWDACLAITAYMASMTFVWMRLESFKYMKSFMVTMIPREKVSRRSHGF